MYRWSKIELYSNYLYQNIINYGRHSEQYEYLLNLIKKNPTLKNSDTIISDSIDYNKLLKHYTKYEEFLTYEIYTELAKLYPLFPDDSLLRKKLKFSKIKLSEKEKINIAYEIIESMNNPEFLKLFKDVINPHKHILHISKNTLNSRIFELKGCTTDANHKLYIINFWDDTIDDIITLIHEFFHYALRKYHYSLFIEVEGHLGERYAIDFLKNTKFKELVEVAEFYNFKDFISSCRRLYFHDKLFETGSHHQFDIDKFNKTIMEEIPYPTNPLSEYQILRFLGGNAYNYIIDILGFLVSLDLKTNTSNINEAIDYNIALKEDPDLIYNPYYPASIDENYQNMFDEYEKIRSIIL